MSKASKVSKFMGMFDKLDDLIYAPIDVVCSWAKQPLKALDARREQKNTEKQERMHMEILDKEVAREKEFEQLKVDLKAAEKRMEIDFEDLKANQLIARNKKVLDAIVDYRKTMLEDAKEIANMLSHMEIELADETHNLVIDKVEKYKAQQKEMQDECDDRLVEIGERFANNERVRIRREDQIMDSCEEMLELSKEFCANLKDDIARINKNNGDRVAQAGKIADEILKGQLGQQVTSINIQNQVTEQSERYIEE